jgi:catechol 2,3-dioxygenase-like lactoylglutathione lyase family enzyme
MTDQVGEDPGGQDTGIRISQVRTVAIPVTDQDRALEFYGRTLGFRTVLDGTFGAGQRWIEVAPPGAATTVALVPATDTTPAGVDTGIRFSTSDATSDHTVLQARGVDVDPEVLRWPGVPPMFRLRDPDGNTVVVVELGSSEG